MPGGFARSNARATYRPHWAFSGSLELIVWAIPTLVITFLGGIAWFGSQALDPFRPLQSKLKPIEVEAVSLDWKWLFIYPDEGVATVNQLVIAAGRPVHFRITSATVWNAFFVPQLGSMIYSMAGMTSQLNLQADKPGTFRGLSSMFSGDKFSDMHFDVRALDADAFDQWVDSAKAIRLGARQGGVRPACADGRYGAGIDLQVRRLDALQGNRRGNRPRTRPGAPLMLGKLSWSAIPFSQPIPMARRF